MPESVTIAHGGHCATVRAELRCPNSHSILCSNGHIEVELERGKLTYAGLAERLKEHRLPDESETTIKAKLKRGAFAATFLVAALEMEGLRLEDLCETDPSLPGC
jgi:hypothetical protein